MTGPGPGQRELVEDACVVIAAFNEVEVIGGVVAELLRSFAHVVVVDDGSRDATAAAAASAGALVVRHPVNLGQGAALLTGIRHALHRVHPKFVVTFDADGQHSPVDAVAMIERARAEGVQVVLGSRFMDECQVSRVRRAVLRAGVAFTRLTTGLALTDAHNGLRVLRADAAAQLGLRLHGMAHASEILGQLATRGWSYVEHPVTIQYSDYSRAKGQRSYNAFNIVYDVAVDRMRAPA